MKKKKKILLVYTNYSSFIKRDYEILSRKFHVQRFHYRSDLNGIKKMLQTLALAKEIIKTDLVFSWFASFHSYRCVQFSRLVGKKVAIAIGGYEVAKVPELEYGALLSEDSVKMITYIHNKANLVLPVEEGLKKDALKHLDVDGKNITAVPSGFDENQYKPKGKKKNVVLTIAYITSWNTAKLKGLDTYCKTAGLLKDIEFVIVGIDKKMMNKFKAISGKNVTLINPLEEKEIIKHLQEAKVYCQLSLREGLPTALSEAMLCECIPVGTDQHGIRTVIGETGFFTKYGNHKLTAKQIRKALKQKSGRKCRERIINNFSFEIREKKLLDLFGPLLK